MSSQRTLEEGEFALLRRLYDVAERSFRAALTAATGSGDTALAGDALRGLAKTYEGKADYSQMAQSASDALAKDMEFWGPQALQVGTDALLAAKAMSVLGNAEAALKFYDQALAVFQLYLAENHPDVVRASAGILLAAMEMGDQEKTMQWHHKLLGVYSKLGDSKDWPEFLQLDCLVSRYIEQDKQAEIEPILKRELNLLQTKFKANEQELRAVMALYSAFLAKCKQPEAAAESAPAPTPSVPSPRPQPSQTGWTDKVSSGWKEMQKSGQLRSELPQFINELLFHLTLGLDSKNAMAKIATEEPSKCPIIAKELKVALEELSRNRKPLALSLRDLGERYSVAELSELGATLAAAEKTGSSVGYQLKQQSQALRDHLKAMQQRNRNTLKAFRPLGW